MGMGTISEMTTDPIKEGTDGWYEDPLQRRYLVALDALHEAEKDAQHWKAVVGQRKEAK